VAVVAAVGAPPSHADSPPRDSVSGGRNVNKTETERERETETEEGE